MIVRKKFEYYILSNMKKIFYLFAFLVLLCSATPGYAYKAVYKQTINGERIVDIYIHDNGIMIVYYHDDGVIEYTWIDSENERRNWTVGGKKD